MDLTGHTLIDGAWTPGNGTAFHAVDPTSGDELDQEFRESGPDQIAAAAVAAHRAAAAYRAVPLHERAAFLVAMAEEIEALGDELLDQVVAETALPRARATGERGRTANQVRPFASVIEEGSFLGRRHDQALPDRAPLPRPDLRMAMVPLGPVAVFGASNFPLAFSVAGGDTASALAAGCPVVVKAHPAHPGVSELVATAVLRAAQRTGMPSGVFAMLHGGAAAGQALVTDPRIRAVGFTGSRAGGLALVEAAAGREVPIPVFAEMSSVNPVVVLPGALADAPSLAADYVDSLTRESGQYCTNPGLIFVPDGDAGDAFVEAAASAVARAAGQPMLTPGIAANAVAGVNRWRRTPGVSILAEGSAAGPLAPAPLLATASLASLDTDPDLADEVFGAAGLVVRYPDLAALVPVLAGLEGQLTATIHGTETDAEAVTELVPVLEDRAGRLLWGGWPTGVEVASAMVHGGPYPATSAPATTSVGTLAIARFLRPVAFQNFPTEMLPAEFR